MSDDARTEIVARVRRASRGASAEVIAEELSQLGNAPLAPLPADDLAESFIANVRRNRASAEQVPTRSAATKSVAQYLYQRYRTRKLVAGNDPRLAAMPWRDGGVLPRFGAAVDGDLASISYARLGVAETGSIVTWTGKANPASNNLLAEDHIVLLDLADLVATAELAWDRINASWGDGPRHRGVNFISAPSSTADIDFQLVMGAHGPRGLHIILVGDMPPPIAAP
jgi:L-lactate dehydrogenase complex protein LldG